MPFLQTAGCCWLLLTGLQVQRVPCDLSVLVRTVGMLTQVGPDDEDASAEPDCAVFTFTCSAADLETQSACQQGFTAEGQGNDKGVV
jgi:hypothetical protein